MICVAFILFHTGETRALLPAMLQMAARPDQYCLRIIPVGQVAKNNLPDTLISFIKIPRFVQAGMGHNDAYHTRFSKEDVQEVIAYCDAFQHIVMGVPSKIQAQIAEALPRIKQRIAYLDVGSDVGKINAFSKHVDMLIVTSLIAQKTAQNIIMQYKLANKPRVLAGRHGDFDTWRERYEQDMPSNHIAAIQTELCVKSTDNVLLWAGGYGDDERLGFIKFLQAFVLFEHKYKLRVTIHPGLKAYSPEKLNQILGDYYIQALLQFGFSKQEACQIFTNLDAFSVACVAHGVVSVSSMVGPQAVSIGVRAKTVFVSDAISPIIGIRMVRTQEAWQVVLNHWLSKKRRVINSENYHQAMNKLSLPRESTWAILEDVLNQEQNKR
ncbi:MAG: hypothetical protein P1U36_06720 [Legionellaceae bacterium]|nr:hypothetical protein [Legionellaceae bacterium]